MVKQQKQKSIRGFTLIELLIAIAIVGILAAVAYPSFVDQIQKSRRAEAINAAMECSALLERRYTLRNTYETDDCDDIGDNLEYYTLRVTTPNCNTNGNNTCFQVRAQYAGSQTADTDCRRFFINQTGRRWARDSSGGNTDEECWKQ